MRSSRRGVGGPRTHHILRVVGGFFALKGFLNAEGTDGQSTYQQWRTGGFSAAKARLANVVTNAKDVFLSGDPFWAPARQQAWGGTIAYAASGPVKSLLPSTGRVVHLGRGRYAIKLALSG